MSSGSQQTRTRSEHVAQIELPPSRFHRAITLLRKGDVLARLGICLTTILAIWVLTGGWSVRMPFRSGMIPERNIIARQTFERVDEEQTQEERERARRSIECVYDNDAAALVDLQQRLKDRVDLIRAAESFDALDASIFAEFLSDSSSNSEKDVAPDESAIRVEHEAIFASLIQDLGKLGDDPELTEFVSKIEQIFKQMTRFGVLEKIEHKLEDGVQSEITVRNESSINKLEKRVSINDVRRSSVLTQLESALETSFDEAPTLQKHVNIWIKKYLPKTLSFNRKLTLETADDAVANVEPVRVTYQAGKAQLAEAGKPLSPEKIELLRREHEAWLKARPWQQWALKALGDIGMYTALFTLCGVYLWYRRHDLLSHYRPLITLQGSVVFTIAAACFAARDGWQGELIPLMLFGITAALAYRQELGLLLSACVCLAVVLTLRQGVTEYVILTGCLASTILLLRRIRTRTKLIYVGIVAGATTFATTMGAQFVSGSILDMPLLTQATWYGFCALLSSVLMTGLLPFIERLFDVQTDISLLELGDVSHPLLQELVRRAPGTYNHSINVASIGESAADSIGANGLLVRVGAYFHDIGKMLKPQYFIENQTDGNRHEALMPAMSTLIIIAHVKDGADLGRQHHLPQTIIDFILQHHGTTLVEYFFSQANRQSEEDPNAGAVDEGSYRYPGPRPQTKEAAVLMLADGVESASRSLQDPAPARIESLVNEIAMKKLLDRQFDECGLTLRELRTIQDSLIKSLTAMYHSRVKYPDQQTA